MSEYRWIGGKCKKYWGIIPIAVFLAGEMVVRLTEFATHSELRSIPQMILSWFGGISIGLLVFWAGRSLLWKNKDQVPMGIRILRNILCVIYSVIIVVAVGTGFFISVFMYSPEHVVERNGTRMVATVHSFLQETVDYYAYKNVLFRGDERIGWEDYGNGGTDPFHQNREPIRSYFRDRDINSE